MTDHNIASYVHSSNQTWLFCSMHAQYGTHKKNTQTRTNVMSDNVTWFAVDHRAFKAQLATDISTRVIGTQSPQSNTAAVHNTQQADCTVPQPVVSD